MATVTIPAGTTFLSLSGAVADDTIVVGAGRTLVVDKSLALIVSVATGGLVRFTNINNVLTCKSGSSFSTNGSFDLRGGPGSIEPNNFNGTSSDYVQRGVAGIG
jgi:hypothetical protein